MVEEKSEQKCDRKRNNKSTYVGVSEFVMAEAIPPGAEINFGLNEADPFAVKRFHPHSPLRTLWKAFSKAVNFGDGSLMQALAFSLAAS